MFELLFNEYHPLNHHLYNSIDEAKHAALECEVSTDIYIVSMETGEVLETVTYADRHPNG